MMHKIQVIEPMENLILVATFKDGTKKKYDIKQLYHIFPQFQDMEKIEGLFEQVKIDTGGYGVSWNDFLDLDAEEIWENGIDVGFDTKMDIICLLAANLSKAREQAGMTQKQLSEKTGIYQSDISKIERGIGNPSIATLKRLAEGMGTVLKIEFIK